MYERLKEKQLKNFQYESHKQEQETIDDMAITRHQGWPDVDLP